VLERNIAMLRSNELPIPTNRPLPAARRHLDEEEEYDPIADTLLAPIQAYAPVPDPIPIPHRVERPKEPESIRQIENVMPPAPVQVEMANPAPRPEETVSPQSSVLPKQQPVFGPSDVLAMNEMQLMIMACLMGWDTECDYAGLTRVSRPKPEETAREQLPVERDHIRIDKFCDTGACAFDEGDDADKAHQYYLKDIRLEIDYHTGERVVELVAAVDSKDYNATEFITKLHRSGKSTEAWQLYVHRNADILALCRERIHPQTFGRTVSKLLGRNVPENSEHAVALRNSMVNVFDSRNPPNSAIMRELLNVTGKHHQRNVLSFLVEEGFVNLDVLDQLLATRKPEDTNDVFRDAEGDVYLLRTLGEVPRRKLMDKEPPGAAPKGSLRALANESTQAYYRLKPYDRPEEYTGRGSKQELAQAFRAANSARSSFSYVLGCCLRWCLRPRTLLDFAIQHHPHYTELHDRLRKHGARTASELTEERLRSGLAARDRIVSDATLHKLATGLMLNPRFEMSEVARIAMQEPELGTMVAEGFRAREAAYNWLYGDHAMPAFLRPELLPEEDQVTAPASANASSAVVARSTTAAPALATTSSVLLAAPASTNLLQHRARSRVLTSAFFA
jgi:hypothetical protein